MPKNIIEYTNIRPKSLLSPQSRYLKQKVIYYGENKFLTFDTYLKNNYTIEGNEKIMLLNKGNEYRPDLVSNQVYGFPDAWWFILETNNIKDVFDFKAGRTIMIPNRSI